MFYKKKVSWEKMQQSKDLNILRLSKNLKSKLVLQKSNITNLTMLLNIMKTKKTKRKKNCYKPNLVYDICFNFHRYNTIKKVAKRFLIRN